MNRKLYLKALQRHVFPVLRDAGFMGSGTTLRRVNDYIVHVFNVQGSTAQDGCYINQGVHLLLLPKPGGGDYDALKIHEAECLFRERLDPGSIQSESHRRWPYGNTEEEMENSARSMRETWKTDGYRFFDHYTEYPNDFLTVVRNVKPEDTVAGWLVKYAELAIVLGEYEQGHIFAQEALEKCPERATGLKAKIMVLIQSAVDLK